MPRTFDLYGPLNVAVNGGWLTVEQYAAIRDRHYAGEGGEDLLSELYAAYEQANPTCRFCDGKRARLVPAPEFPGAIGKWQVCLICEGRGRRRTNASPWFATAPFTSAGSAARYLSTFLPAPCAR